MPNVNDDPATGYNVMYSGKPSKPGKTHQQIGFGLVAGDGVGLEDNADLPTTGQIKYGLVEGGQRDYYEEVTKTNNQNPFRGRANKPTNKRGK